MDMPKPPPKVGVIMLRLRSEGGKVAQTQATTAAIAARNTAEEPNAPTANLSEGVKASTGLDSTTCTKSELVAST